MNRHHIHIDYDAEAGKFAVRCPYWANDLVCDLPSRRWSKSKRAWMAPVIRKNAEFIKNKLSPYASITKAAEEQIVRIDQAVRAGANKGGFPAWYPFKTTPRAHQRKAIDKGYGLYAYGLFMDMQTGKSKVAIDLCCAWRMEAKIDAVLILCKLTLRRNWEKQLRLHAPIPWDLHYADTARVREFENWMGAQHDFPIMAVGFESLSQGRMFEIVERFLLAHPKAAIIADETSYISGHKALRAERSVRFGRMADRRLALTGTPITDGPMNLYMQFEYLDPNIIGIGDYYAFRNRYAVMGGFRKTDDSGKRGPPLQIVGYQNLDELIETVSPYVFQVTKEEAYDLPGKRYQTRVIELTKTQMDLYRQIRREGALQFKGDPELVLKNVLEVALRLHQVAGGYTVKAREVRKGDKVKVVYDPVPIVQPKDNPKVQEIVDTIEEARDKKGLIWCVYKPEIQAVVWALKRMGKRVGELHGGIPEEDRQPIVDGFEAGDYDWIVGNASTGGMGYTMQAGEINIFYNNTFKLIDRLQAEDRAYGDGQEKSQAYIDILAERTVDFAILEALGEKKDLADFVRARLGRAIQLLDGESLDSANADVVPYGS